MIFSVPRDVRRDPIQMELVLRALRLHFPMWVGIPTQLRGTRPMFLLALFAGLYLAIAAVVIVLCCADAACRLLRL